MNQEISYRIRFTFPETETERESMLPSVDLFLRTLEKADRILVGALGLEMDYRRALREMGEDHFRYKVTLVLRWPQQILLGTWPEPSSLREWMGMARGDLFSLSDGGDVDAQALVSRWDGWAKQLGLSGTLVYIPPFPNMLLPLTEDLRRAIGTLGGGSCISLD